MSGLPQADSGGGAEENGVPMVDHGWAGLAQSVFHPNAGIGEFNPEKHGDVGMVVEIDATDIPTHPAYQKIAEIISGNALQQVWHIVQAALTATPPYPQDDTVITSKADLKAVIQDILAEEKTSTKASWATIAATAPAPGRSALEPPPKIAPARHEREVVVIGSTIAEGLRGRSPLEVVQAVNTATSSDTAIATRRLPSGDIVVTFRGSAAEYRSKTVWTQDAFGPEAKLSQRAQAVVVKRVPLAALNKQNHCSQGDSSPEPPRNRQRHHPSYWRGGRTASQPALQPWPYPRLPNIRSRTVCRRH